MKRIVLYIIISLTALISSFCLGKYVFPKNYNKTIIYSPTEITLPDSPENDKPVTLIEFSDMECPHSIKAHARIQKVLARKEYTRKIRYVYKAFPLKAHENGAFLAKAVLAAELQGKGDAMREGLYDELERVKGQKKIQYQKIVRHLAAQLNLDISRFKQDIDSAMIEEKYSRETGFARDLNIGAVPMVYINGHPLKGTQQIETYEALINKLLSRI